MREKSEVLFLLSLSLMALAIATYNMVCIERLEEKVNVLFLHTDLEVTE